MCDIERLNCAVRDCLNLCLRDKAPVARLTGFKAWLRARPQWREQEVAAVETATRRLLGAIVQLKD